MSLDGFISDRNGDVSRLYADMEAMHASELLQESIRETGAVLMGRRAFEMGDPDQYVGSYEYQVPIFVLTHHPPARPPKQDDKLTFTFVTDGAASAIQQARAAAGNKTVTVVGGANTTQQLIRAGLFDEIEVDVMPLLLGDGLRLFDNLGPGPIELEQVRVLEQPAFTHLRYRAVRPRP
jgi:dihydrofolate reductase